MQREVKESFSEKMTFHLKSYWWIEGSGTNKCVSGFMCKRPEKKNDTVLILYWHSQMADENMSEVTAEETRCFKGSKREVLYPSGHGFQSSFSHLLSVWYQAS